MKNLILIFISIFIYHSSLIACSYFPDSFCVTSSEKEDNLIVSGKIIAIDSDGIDLQVLNILRGEYDREILRIWDGTDFDCNGIFSMAASDLGNVNDSIIIILPKIDIIQNTWDVIGDYRRPEYFGYEPVLSIQNSIIYGLIKGLVEAPEEYRVTSMGYNEFIETWAANGDCSDIKVGVNEVNKSQVIIQYNNPVDKSLDIKIINSNNSLKTIEIFNMLGTKLKTIKSTNQEINLSVSDMPNGHYFIRLMSKQNEQKIYKFIKI